MTAAPPFLPPALPPVVAGPVAPVVGAGPSRPRRSRVERPIPRVGWDDHVAYLDGRWKPGEHCSIIAKTGDGKSNLVRQLVDEIWSDARVLVIDPTGDDINFGTFRTVKGHPSKLQRMHARPFHYRMTPPSGVAGRIPVRQAFERTRGERSWVLVIDEVRKVTDPRDPCYGLAAQYEEQMTRARKLDVTVISCTQAPRYVPSCFYDQPTYAYISRLRDRKARLRLEEISGADTEDIVSGLNLLSQFEFLFVGPDETMCIVKAPKVTSVTSQR